MKAVAKGGLHMAEEERHDTIDALLAEHRTFPPPEDFKKNALVADAEFYDAAAADDEGFWARQAADLLTWDTEWDTILDWQLPFAKWFVGGKLNVSAQLPRPPRRGRAAATSVAILWEGEPGDTRTVTYADLHAEVQQFANVLKSLGVVKGDRVTIYLPMIPEAAIAMLACARIGATHSVVFGGFSSQSLADRINDAEAKVLITADGGYRRGEVFPLKPAADEAVANTTTIEHVVVVRRGGNDVEMVEGRDLWYHDLMAAADAECPAEPMDSRGPPLPPLHVGHHRQAEGDHAHDRRLPHPGRLHPQVRLRPPPRQRRLLVHRRRRLGHRPQLHRLRPARQRRDSGDVRGRAQLPRQRPLLGDRRQVPGHDVLHGADGDPHVHEVGRRRSPPSTTCRACELLGTVGEPINPEAWMWYHEHIGTAAARSSTPGGRPRPAGS